MGGEECRSSRKTSVCLPKGSIFNAFPTFQGDIIVSIYTRRKGEMLPKNEKLANIPTTYQLIANSQLPIPKY